MFQCLSDRESRPQEVTFSVCPFGQRDRYIFFLSPSHLSRGPLPDELPAADPELDTEHGRVSAPRARPLTKLVILYTLYTPGASLWALAKPVTAEVLLPVGAGAGRLEERVGSHLRNNDK